MSYQIDVEDVEYVRHGAEPLLARVFKPRGTGPFPLIVELHGGAWCRGDRLSDTTMNEPLARSGANPFLPGEVVARLRESTLALQRRHARAFTPQE